MVELSTSTSIDRPAAEVFAYLADYRRLTEWVFGITTVRPVGNLDYGLGAVFKGAVDLGPKTLSSEAKITDWEQDRRIAVASLAGFDFTATMRLHPETAARTGLNVELCYGTSGGVAAKAFSRSIEPLITMAARHTTEKLRHACTRAVVQPEEDNANPDRR